MSSHGRSGINRWIRGSVANALVRASGDPVLVVPPTEIVKYGIRVDWSWRHSLTSFSSI